MKVLLMIAILACLAGCAGSYEEPAIPPGHPANPDAPAGAVPAATGTLSVDGDDPIPPLQRQGDQTGSHP